MPPEDIRFHENDLNPMFIMGIGNKIIILRNENPNFMFSLHPNLQSIDSYLISLL